LAGHRQLGTTQRYISVTPEQKRKAVELIIRWPTASKWKNPSAIIVYLWLPACMPQRLLNACLITNINIRLQW